MSGKVGRPDGVSPGAFQQALGQVGAHVEQVRQQVPTLPPEVPKNSFGLGGMRIVVPGLDAIRARFGHTKVTPEQVEAAEAKVAQGEAVQVALQNVVDQLGRWHPMNVEQMDRTGADAVLDSRSKLLQDVSRLQAALDAAGPEVAAMFPKDQLDALREAALVDHGKAEAHKVTLARRQRLDALLAERAARKEAAAKAEAARSAPTDKAKPKDFGRFFRRDPEPIPDAVVLKLDTLKTQGAIGEALAQRLGDPELSGLAKAALRGAKGVEKKQLQQALAGYAMLADYATGSLDYKEVGVAMFGHPKCRRSHQARSYDARLMKASLPRQQDSQASLRDALKAALTSEDPVAAVPKAHVQGFLREVGVPASVAKGFAPKSEAVTQALQDELFAPLRALNEAVTSGRYRGEVGRAVLGQVHEVTQAVVEGRYGDWRLDHPHCEAQLAHLDAGQREAWLGSSPRETKLEGGKALKTREAEGHDLFWATKVGGPSHAFDTMSWCILSLLGNARTKAIVLEHDDWHQVAARAYLRLFKDVEGNPVVYLDPTQIDFPHREHHRDKSRDIGRAMLEHAVAKAQALGASLAVAGAPHGLRDLGYDPVPMPKPLVLEPNRMVVEASDTLGRGHDWVQTEREIVHPKAAFVSAADLAG